MRLIFFEAISMDRSRNAYAADLLQTRSNNGFEAIGSHLGDLSGLLYGV